MYPINDYKLIRYEVEVLTKEGALLARIKKRLGDRIGNVFDFGCGSGIASVVYSRLTNSKINAIDIDIKHAYSLVKSLKEEKIKIIKGSYDELLKMLKKEEIVYAGSAETSVYNYLLKKLHEGKFDIFIMSIAYDEKEEREMFKSLINEGRISILRVPLVPAGEHTEYKPL